MALKTAKFRELSGLSRFEGLCPANKDKDVDDENEEACFLFDIGFHGGHCFRTG
jgi:hypothetical protein